LCRVFKKRRSPPIFLDRVRFCGTIIREAISRGRRIGFIVPCAGDGENVLQSAFQRISQVRTRVRFLLLFAVLALLGNGVAFGKGSSKSKRPASVSRHTTPKGKKVKAYKRADAGTPRAKNKAKKK
jgi:hypothetical protein